MNRQKVCLALLAGLGSMLNFSSAFPTGAGCCDAGPGVLGPHTGGDLGEIEDGGLEVLLDGNQLTPSSSSICRGQTSFVTLQTHVDQASFRGFRLRIEAADAFDVEEGSEARIMSTGDRTCFVPFAECPLGVSGVTHQDGESKTEVGGIRMKVDEVGIAVLEVTVIRSLREWYFSIYGIEVLECDEPEGTPEQGEDIQASQTGFDQPTTIRDETNSEDGGLATEAPDGSNLKDEGNTVESSSAATPSDEGDWYTHASDEDDPDDR